MKSILSLFLFSAFINELNDTIKNLLLKFNDICNVLSRLIKSFELD